MCLFCCHNDDYDDNDQEGGLSEWHKKWQQQPWKEYESKAEQLLEPRLHLKAHQRAWRRVLHEGATGLRSVRVKDMLHV
jgi:hypothetical protein